MLTVPQYLHPQSTEFKDLLQIMYSLGFQIQRGCYVAPYSNLVNYKKGAHVDLDGTGWFCVFENGPGTASGVIYPPDDLSHVYWVSDSRLSLTDTSRIGVLEQTYMNNLTYIGEIREFVLPNNKLRPGWHALTGEGHSVSSTVGIRLAWLRTQPWWITLENGWAAAADVKMKISQVGDIIYLPKWAHTDGRLPITRPVDGITRKVGSLEDDAIQEITATNTGASAGASTGAAYVGTTNTDYGGGKYYLHTKQFSASRVVRTSTETRALSRGTTIAINLMDHLLAPISHVTDPI